MNRKKNVLIILIIGLLLIGMGIVLIVLKGKSSNIDYDAPSNEIDTSITDFDTVYGIAESLYGGNENVVEVVEEMDKFIIFVRNFEGYLLNTFNMDKETGTISEESTTISSSISN